MWSKWQMLERIPKSYTLSTCGRRTVHKTSDASRNILVHSKPSISFLFIYNERFMPFGSWIVAAFVFYCAEAHSSWISSSFADDEISVWKGGKRKMLNGYREMELFCVCVCARFDLRWIYSLRGGWNGHCKIHDYGDTLGLWALSTDNWMLFFFSSFLSSL